METKVIKIDLVKLIKYMLKRIWLIAICAVTGFIVSYTIAARSLPTTYTATGTLYVNNGNPNLEEYHYISINDMDVVTSLVKTYLTVVRSKSVLNKVVEKLADDYPGITAEYISSTVSMSAISETGLLAVSSTTTDPKMSMDITNAVLEAAPQAILNVVEGGRISVIDNALLPSKADAKSSSRRGMLGGIAGFMAAVCLLLLLYLSNHRISESSELKKNYTPPILAAIPRLRKQEKDNQSFLLSEQSPLEVTESYSRLGMNLMRKLSESNTNIVAITSSVSGEGKTTIAANLAAACAAEGTKVLLIDADMRRACLNGLLGADTNTPGLSDVISQNCELEEAINKGQAKTPDILFAGEIPDHPVELMKSAKMKQTLEILKDRYDLILLDTPSINVVSDTLYLSNHSVGCLIVVRKNYTDHRELRKALVASDMAGLKIHGFVYYGENLNEGGYYSKRLYKRYYNSESYQRTK